jgi:hypothetical protein
MFKTHSKVGGYSITYEREGLAYCGACIADAIAEDTEVLVCHGLTYHDERGLSAPSDETTCETCNVTVSN